MRLCPSGPRHGRYFYKIGRISVPKLGLRRARPAKAQLPTAIRVTRISIERAPACIEVRLQAKTGGLGSSVLIEDTVLAAASSRLLTNRRRSGSRLASGPSTRGWGALRSPGWMGRWRPLPALFLAGRATMPSRSSAASRGISSWMRLLPWAVCHCRCSQMVWPSSVRLSWGQHPTVSGMSAI